MNEEVEKNLFDLLHFLMINIIVFGLMGNFMCFRIFHLSSLRKHHISVFFRTIAVIDSFMLVNACFLFVYQKFDVNLANLNVVFCKFKSYLVYANGPTSPWLMVVISFDRFISIRFPKRFSYIFTIKFQALIIFFLFVFNYSYYAFIIFNTFLETG